jgi:hypothetical protein
MPVSTSLCRLTGVRDESSSIRKLAKALDVQPKELVKARA